MLKNIILFIILRYNNYSFKFNLRDIYLNSFNLKNTNSSVFELKATVAIFPKFSNVLKMNNVKKALNILSKL